MERVRPYRGERSYVIRLGDVVRELPLVRVDEKVWIASDASIILGDIEFISAAAKLMAEKLKGLDIDLIVTPEAKSIAFAYETAKLLGHSRIIIGRKGVKAYMLNHLAEEVKAITTKERQLIVLNGEDIKLIRGRRIALLDDVVSTGGTIKALEKLVKRAGGRISCRAAIWIEGPWYKGDLIHLGELPVFVTGEKLREFKEGFR